jgi:signal transduction histidine kinase
MLHELLTAHRADLIARCRQKVASRPAPKATPTELEHGVPIVIDQLIRALQSKSPGRDSDPGVEHDAAASTSPGPRMTEIRRSASLHGRELLDQGFTVDQVVHDYGDLCQAVTELAMETGAPIEVEEFRILNRSLDDAIAGAVTEYSVGRDRLVSELDLDALNQRQGFLAHEMRNLIHRATLAITVIKAGNVGLNGATGAVLDGSLIQLRDLIDRSLAEVRSTAGLPARLERISVAEFIRDVSRSASLEARAANCRFTVADVDPQLAVDADRDLLFSATSNLLQNAFKFTRRRTEVSLNAYASGDRILIDIEDRCGGLARGATDTMFLPFTQAGADRSGLGLGLSICRHNVEANGGVLSVRNAPGTGCVFTISLPRHALSS